MKKILMLTAAFMMFQSLPVLADDHEGGHEGKPKMERAIKGDTNGDGMISKDEFLSKAQERFGTTDANGDGNIDRDEAKAAHEKRRAEKKEKRSERKEKKQERKAERAEKSTAE
jgi:hypothetical protein